MIFKIQKPVVSSDDEDYYLVYNQRRNIMLNDIKVGDFPELDKMFDDEYKIYVEGYLDSKGRFRIKRKTEYQDW